MVGGLRRAEIRDGRVVCRAGRAVPDTSLCWLFANLFSVSRLKGRGQTHAHAREMLTLSHTGHA